MTSKDFVAPYRDSDCRRETKDVFKTEIMLRGSWWVELVGLICCTGTGACVDACCYTPVMNELILSKGNGQGEGGSL